MSDVERLLTAALRERGITSPDVFTAMYGVALDSVPLATALALVRQPDSPRTPDRATWTPRQRERYVVGCIAALTSLRGRLTRGLAILDARPTVAAEVRWLTLATRAVRLIARLARADRAAEATFFASDLGRWYVDLEWPEPSHAARLLDW